MRLTTVKYDLVAFFNAKGLDPLFDFTGHHREDMLVEDLAVLMRDLRDYRVNVAESLLHMPGGYDWNLECLADIAEPASVVCHHGGAEDVWC